ncbi:MAG: radical SAM protein, partial [Ruminococcaceae bacterium]|nr:radical SAM protein [Oscillospiraceae bacterium]
LPKGHYDSLVDYAVDLGIKNAFIQDGASAKESFIPEFYTE